LIVRPTLMQDPRYLRLSKAARAVLLCSLAPRADRDGIAWPSLRTICRDTGWSINSVVEGIRELDAVRFAVVKHERDSAGEAKVNRYRVRLETPPGGYSCQ
jgi:hypothetical protein